MRDPNNETQTTEEKLFHFSQAGAINDPSLNQLRDQIKKVMIPLLIKTFQLKLELNQSLSLPSRLQNLKNRFRFLWLNDICGRLCRFMPKNSTFF